MLFKSVVILQHYQWTQRILPTVKKFMPVYKYSDVKKDVVDWAPRDIKKGAYLDIQKKISVKSR